MNIQIFGTKKSADTRKAERFFKERGIRYQFVYMKEKGMSMGEFISVAQAVGGLDQLTDLVISRKPDEYGSVHLSCDFNRAEGIVYDMLIRICSRKGACSIR